MRKSIKVSRISLESCNRLSDAGYEVRFVSTTPGKKPFVLYTYDRPITPCNKPKPKLVVIQGGEPTVDIKCPICGAGKKCVNNH